jgi:zinc/manganese transport system substrate-binding protein
MHLRNHLSQRRLLALPLLLLVAAGCGASSSAPGRSSQATEPVYAADAGAITVTGAENFYADLLHQLGGSRLKIYSFLSDPSADPHLYESNASNARAVADSRLVIENGLGYDSFMDKLLKASPKQERVLINVQDLIGAKDGANPHVWYDPTVMPRVATAAEAALARLDPAHAGTYAANLETFKASLKPIDDQVASLRQRHAGAPVAFTEPVYGYMAEAIGLAVKSPTEFMKAVEEGNDPPSKAVAAEQDLITGHQVKVLMYNSQTVTKVTSNVKELAMKNGVPVVGVSETTPPGKTFQDWQLSTLRELGNALDARGLA